MNNAAGLLAIIGAGVAAIVVVLALTVEWRPTVKPIRSKRAPLQLTQQQKLFGIIGLAVGVLLFMVKGWVVMLITAPIAGLVLPALLGKGSAPQKIERLEALELWTRSLSGLTTSGTIGLEQTIVASLSSCPEAIRPQVTSLVARLNARWITKDALEAFAEDFDDPTADLIVMHLLLKERSHGAGLAKALEDLAEVIGEEIKVRRQIETDRAKPRTQVRIVTIATLIVLAALPFGGVYTAGYSSLFGQLLLTLWILAFAVLLWWMRSIAASKPAPRLLVAPAEAAPADEEVTA